MADPIQRLNAALKGRYRIARPIAEGGMATVYLAEDLRHQRPVAVKVLTSELTAAIAAQRFVAEIRMTASLQHPHILPLFDSGEAGAFLFYVMPFVEGETLRDMLNREGRLPVAQAVSITTGIASALQYAHERGIVHRDVKPENVMFSGGLPVVTDFGVALALQNAGDRRLTVPGAPLGTAPYVSPEQASGEGSVDGRSDIYSLGCVLYELLTGETPHLARTAVAVVAKRLTVPAARARTLRNTLPAHIDAALNRALQADPDDRHQSVEEFTRELRAVPAQAPTHRSSASPAEPIAPARTPLVGRARERAQLLERLEAAAKGRGSLVLLGGEPGIGKTRLIEFLLEEARSRGYMCVVGHAYEVEGTPPFAPFLEQLEYTARVVPPETLRTVLGEAAPEIARIMPALRQQFDDIGPAIELPPDQARHYLFHRYGDFLARAAQVRPLVAFFDDLHWADESSLLLIEHLARQMHGMPVLTLGAYRDSELNAARPLAKSLERLLRQHSLYRISLKPLSKREVGELLGVLGGSPSPGALVETISRGTEGNPFFVHEMFRHLNEEGRLFDEQGLWRTDLSPGELDVPAGVRLVVGRRLQRVSRECQSLLSAAAVIGSRFSLPLLEAVGDMSEAHLLDALEEAGTAQLAQPIGKREPVYGFTHELIRQTLLDGLSVPRRQRQHLRIAAALENTRGGRIEQRAADVANHLYQAGATADSAKTLHFLRLSADQALERAGYHEALAQYDRALSLDAVPEDLVPVLMEGKMKALDGMGRWAEVIDVGKRALRMFEATSDSEGLARVARLVCYRLDWRARYREAVDVGRPALEALSEAPGPHRARLRCQVGLAMDLLNEPGALELIELGLAEAEALGEIGAVLHGKLALAIWHYHQGFFARAVQICEEGSKLLGDAADQTTRGDFLWIQALTVPLLGRLDRAAEVVQEARAVGKERNEVGAELCAAFGEIALGAMRTGDGRRVEALGRELAEGFHAARVWARAGYLWAGIGRLWHGDAAGAAELMGLDSPDSGEPRLWSSLSRSWRFRTAAYARRPDAASLYERVELSLFRAGRRAFPGDAFGLHAAIEGLVVLGDLETAAGLYEDAVASLDWAPSGTSTDSGSAPPASRPPAPEIGEVPKRTSGGLSLRPETSRT